MIKTKVFIITVGVVSFLNIPMHALGANANVSSSYAYRANNYNDASSSNLVYSMSPVPYRNLHRAHSRLHAYKNYTNARTSYKNATESQKWVAYKMYAYAYKQWYYANLNYRNYGRIGKYISKQAYFDYHNDRWTGYFLTRNSRYKDKEGSYTYYADKYDALSSYYQVAGIKTGNSTYRWKSYYYSKYNLNYAKAAYNHAKRLHKTWAGRMYTRASRQKYWAALNYTRRGRYPTNQASNDYFSDIYAGRIMYLNAIGK